MCIETSSSLDNMLYQKKSVLDTSVGDQLATKLQKSITSLSSKTAFLELSIQRDQRAHRKVNSQLASNIFVGSKNSSHQRTTIKEAKSNEVRIENSRFEFELNVGGWFAFYVNQVILGDGKGVEEVASNWTSFADVAMVNEFKLQLTSVNLDANLTAQLTAKTVKEIVASGWAKKQKICLQQKLTWPKTHKDNERLTGDAKDESPK